MQTPAEQTTIENLKNRHDMLQNCLQSLYNGSASKYAPSQDRGGKARAPPGRVIGDLLIDTVTEVFREKETIRVTLLKMHGVELQAW
jgi:hypothetical protein